MSSPVPVEITPVLNLKTDALQALTDAALETESRTRVQEILSTISEQMQQAQAIWQDYADNAQPGSDRWTAVMWVGAERARELHRIHLALRTQAAELTQSSGVRFRDTVGMVPELDIVEAYVQLAEGETGPERAEQAITTIGSRRARIAEVQKSIG